MNWNLDVLYKGFDDSKYEKVFFFIFYFDFHPAYIIVSLNI